MVVLQRREVICVCFVFFPPLFLGRGRAWIPRWQVRRSLTQLELITIKGGLKAAILAAPVARLSPVLSGGDAALLRKSTAEIGTMCSDLSCEFPLARAHLLA